MDLGSLELQIFVSLTVVLGGAFVALVCDYLKGNNEQLREHNIELRVRKEEQERRLLLDPAGVLGQYLPGAKPAPLAQMAAPQRPAAVARTVAPHEVMQSFAAPEALSEADTRAARLNARGGDEHFDEADVPPVSHRRGRRKRPVRNEEPPEQAARAPYADWVRPEVIARVARRAESAAAYSNDIPEELDAKRANSIPAPARETLPVAAQVVSAPPVSPRPPVQPEIEATEEEPRMTAEEASRLQREIERVAQLGRQPLAPAPGTILRPLTVPALRLEDEIQRVAERVTPPAAWNSPLLDEVIAASGTRTRVSVEPEALLETIEIAVPEVLAPVAAVAAPAAEVLYEMEPVPAVVEVVAAQVSPAPVVENEPAVELAESIQVGAGMIGNDRERRSSESHVIELEPEPLVTSPLPARLAPPAYTLIAIADPEPESVAAFESPSQMEQLESPRVPFAPDATVDSSPDRIATTELEPSPAAPISELPVVWIDMHEPIPEAAEPVPAEGIFGYYALRPHLSRLAGMGISPANDYLPILPAVEKPGPVLVLFDEPALSLPESSQSEASESETLPDLLPAYADLSWEPIPAPEVTPLLPATYAEPAFSVDQLASPTPVPPPFWQSPDKEATDLAPAAHLSEPIDITSLRQPEANSPVQAQPIPTIPDILLPTGMHDSATWARLLAVPNPMTGILFVISLQASDTGAAVEKSGRSPVAENGPAIDRLMASFVREGDFGTKVAENEWIFIYNHDVTGFNQRRVGMISEKLWDFQLRHLGMANVSFKWGAVDVKSEPVGAAVEAARDRMNQTRRTRKLPTADQAAPRRVVNG